MTSPAHLGKFMTGNNPSNMFVMQDIVCPVCADASASVVGYRGGTAHPHGLGIRTRIVKCNNCGHLYPNPYPFPKDLGDVYGEADEYFKEHTEAQILEGRQGILQWLEALREGRTGTLLDIGAGRGELVRVARERGWDAQGIEPVPAFVKSALRDHGTELRCALFDADDFTARSFDAVTLSAVLEHVPEPRQLVTGIQRVLKPGGLLFLDIPNEASLPFRLGNLYYRLRGRDWTMNLAPTFPPFHVQGFGRSSIKRLLKDAGFSVAGYRTYAGTVFDHRPGRLAALERAGFSLAASIAARLNDGPYIELVARADATSD